MIEDCDKALSLDDKSTKAYRRKALACMNLVRFDEAINNFKKFLALEKDQTTQRDYEDCQSLQKNYLKAVECLKNDDYQEGLSSINYVLGKIENQDLLLIKGELQAKLGDVDDANAILRKIDTTGRPAEAMYLKGLIELNSGDSNRAKKFFTEGMRLDPDNQKIRQALLKAKKG